MKIQNALVSNRFDQSQRYFAHVTTVKLSWRVQNIVVIGRVYFTLECFEFSSNFKFDRNMLGGTGARSPSGPRPPKAAPPMLVCDLCLSVWPLLTHVQILQKVLHMLPHSHIKQFHYQSWDNLNICSFMCTCTMSQWAVSSWNLSWTWALRDHLDNRPGNLFWTPGRCTAHTTHCALAVK